MEKDYAVYSLIKNLLDQYKIVFESHKEYQKFIKDLASILEI